MSINEVKHTKYAGYHLATNGLVQRFIQTANESDETGDYGDMNKKIANLNFLLTYNIGKDPWVAGNVNERGGPLLYKEATDKGLYCCT